MKRRLSHIYYKTMAMKYQNQRKNRIQRAGSASRGRSVFSGIRIGVPRRRRRAGRRAMLRLPGGFCVSRTAVLLITLVAAVLLALGLRSHFGAGHPPDGLQTSYANGLNTAMTDGLSTSEDQSCLTGDAGGGGASGSAGSSDSGGGSGSAGGSDSGSVPASASTSSASPSSSTEFPADFSADLSLDPSSTFLAPISRGAGTSNTIITTLAVSRLGDACFQPQAAPGEYLDCSALVQWCYSRLGIGIPRTAAGQAEYCQQHKLSVSRAQLQCGDLIFWSFEKNGRFRDISHTGIYAGNGKIIDASYSRGQVVYRDLYSPDKIVMYGRIPTGR